MTFDYSLQQLIFFGIFAVELVVGLSLVFIWHEVKSKRKGMSKITDSTYQQLEEIVTQTVEKSQEVLARAHHKYAELEKQLEYSSEAFKERSKTMQDQFDHWQKELFTEEAKELDEQIQDASQDAAQLLKTRVTSQTQLVEQELKKLVNQVADTLRTEIKTIVEQTKSELSQEKTAELEKLAAYSEGLVKQVARDVLHKTLTREDHHQLTMELLKKTWEQQQLKT